MRVVGKPEVIQLDGKFKSYTEQNDVREVPSDQDRLPSLPQAPRVCDIRRPRMHGTPPNWAGSTVNARCDRRVISPKIDHCISGSRLRCVPRSATGRAAIIRGFP